MKTKVLFTGMFLALGAASILPLRAEEPIIPPTIAKIWPAGLQRGTTVVFTVDGRNLSDAKEVLFDAPGIQGKVTNISSVPEEVVKSKDGLVSQDAAVAQGKKQSAKLEITAAKDTLPGIHELRIQTPLGTTNTIAFAVGALPEVSANKQSTPGTSATPRQTELPATLVGTIAAPGNVDRYQFDGKAGEELVFQVQASQLGSSLNSLLSLSDASGRPMAQAGEYDSGPDAELTYKLPREGKYTLSVTDREKSGGMNYFYRLNAGALPYITGHFPLGVRAGSATNVAVSGVNLGGNHSVEVQAPASAVGWSGLPLSIQNNGIPALNKVKLAVGNEPEVLEREPNDTVAEAQALSLPITVNGRIDGGTSARPDADFFRFRAKKGEQLSIEVAAGRLGSPLDSVIEVLDAKGNAIPRAAIRCLNQTTTTLSDRDSLTTALRFTSTSGLREGDYVMVGDELDQIARIMDQPDTDIFMKGIDGTRMAFLGTSPDLHAINTLVYKVQILPAGADFPSNGLPVFHLTWRNDDGGPGYGPDSRLDFVAPEDGDYILHLKDVRGMQGPDFAYRLTLRDVAPDFEVSADPPNPNIPQGGSTRVMVSANRLEGYNGPIEIEVQGLPQGATANSAVIPQGQSTTVLVLSAASNVSLDTPPAPIKILGRARIGDRDVERIANSNPPPDMPRQPPLNGPLQVASIIPPPDVVVTTNPKEISLEPGKDITVTLHVARQNGFKGRVPCFVENLPPGVKVVNLGLNGILVTESQTSRTFVLHAEDWAKPIEQPIYVLAQVESNSPTLHPSDPLVVTVTDGKQLASVNHSSPGPGDAPSR